jgi:protein-disulfide isomerase
LITSAEVLEAAASQLVELEQKRYDALKGALDRMVEDRLLEIEAAKRNIDVEALIEAEVRSKLSEPSDEDLRAMYEQYKNAQPLRGKTYEESRDLLLREMQSRQASSLYEGLIDRLRGASKVAVHLDPPRFDVAEDGNPSLGPDSAPVTIIAFTDYECPYCSRAEATIQRVLTTYPKQVRMVVRDFPLAFHKNAQKAHEAAGCAFEQGKFEEMHARLFENQRALGVDALTRYAQEIGLDTEKFSACLSSDSRAEEVRADMKAGAAVGVQGTPAFFVNGRFVNGAQPFEAFQAIIDEELGKTSN